jgi:hypothetical protein
VRASAFQLGGAVALAIVTAVIDAGFEALFLAGGVLFGLAARQDAR